MTSPDFSFLIGTDSKLCTIMPGQPSMLILNSEDDLISANFIVFSFFNTSFTIHEKSVRS